MDELLLETAAYSGLEVDLRFTQSKPNFGDLFTFCGDEHPKFPPSGEIRFEALAELGFEQVDDCFGVTSDEEEGDDVTIWLFPLMRVKPFIITPARLTASGFPTAF